MRRLVVAAVLLVAACQSPESRPISVPTLAPPTSARPPTVAPTPTRAAPSPSPLWVVGAHPLPLRPDGFGQVLPTPRVLRNRRLPTIDVLPPPADGRFHARISRITPAIRVRMGSTWHSGCPVPLSGLRYVRLVFRGFDGRAHTGQLVVAASAAPGAVRIFRRLFALGFPLEQMQLPHAGATRPTGDGNDTAGFVCRTARGQKRLSAHAYGLAIDVNPFQNPYVKGDLVLPELASAYRDRDWVRPGMLLPRSAAVRAFAREGWIWGGTFRSLKDYQHFTLTGG